MGMPIVAYLNIITYAACIISKDIGPVQSVIENKLASEKYICHFRPFRLAIDISIWLFRIQYGKGGTNL